MNARQNLLHVIALRLAQQQPRPVLRVAIDGVDGAGKTTFADELAVTLQQQGRRVIRASVDGFHHPKARRYRLGRHSPEGFYRDSYDYEGLYRALLEPLGPGGSGRYRTAIFDSASDMPLQEPELQASPGDLLLLDGLFLHQPELRGVWDDSIFLHVAFEVSVPRGASRGPGYGSPDPLAESNERYVEGNRLYFREAAPSECAGLIVDNNDLDQPRLLSPSLLAQRDR